MQIVRISPKNSFNPFDPLFTELFEPLRLKVSAGPSYNLILIIILCISSLNRINRESLMLIPNGSRGSRDFEVSTLLFLVEPGLIVSK